MKLCKNKYILCIFHFLIFYIHTTLVRLIWIVFVMGRRTAAALLGAALFNIARSILV